MEQVPLAAQKRTVLGRKVKTLRKEGLVPAHIFGNKIKTEHIQVNGNEFKKVYEQAGETGIIAITVDGHQHPVLVRNIQIHPLTDVPLHIDFYQVNLLEKVKVNVPLEIVGEAPAVEKKIGLLLTPVTEIEIEALPTDIPESIEIDITKLENIDDAIKVADLPVDKSKIEVQADPELVVVQIGELVTKEMEEVAAEAEAEAAVAAETTEHTEGEEKAEGEEAKEEPVEGEKKAEPEDKKAEPKE